MHSSFLLRWCSYDVPTQSIAQIFKAAILSPEYQTLAVQFLHVCCVDSFCALLAALRQPLALFGVCIIIYEYDLRTPQVPFTFAERIPFVRYVVTTFLRWVQWNLGQLCGRTNLLEDVFDGGSHNIFCKWLLEAGEFILRQKA